LHVCDCDVLYQKSIYGDITDRQQLRRRLQCRSFSWYLKNIYPELFVPSDALASGEVSIAYLLSSVLLVGCLGQQVVKEF